MTALSEAGGRNRRWQITGPPTGRSIRGCLRMEYGERPEPGPGELLVRNLWLSLDPTSILTMADYAAQAPADGRPRVMQGLAVSRVLASNIPTFSRGDLVHGISGWEDYSSITGEGFYPTWKVPEGATPAEALGVFGATGMAAYFGMVEVARPLTGETVLVSGAAGGVGSIASQIARIRGAKVIGVAGGPAKCAWLLGEARVSAAIDHREGDLAQRLDAAAPNGIDVFFDNVGGGLLDLALERLRPRGRIVICGGTARYAAEPRPPGPSNLLALTMVQGRMEGLLARSYLDRYPEAIAALRGWIAAGQLRPLEDVMEGLENAPSALERLFRGENLGKQLLRIADASVS